MGKCSTSQIMETADRDGAAKSFLRYLKANDINEYRRIISNPPWEVKNAVIPETAVMRTSPVSKDAARRSLLIAQIKELLKG